MQSALNKWKRESGFHFIFYLEIRIMVQGNVGHSGVQLVRRNENEGKLCCKWAFIVMPLRN